MTSYLVANAIVLTASSFLAKRYGRKAFFMAAIALFTVSSVLCGLAWSLESLLFFGSCRGSAAAAWRRWRNRSWRIPSAREARPGLRPLRRRHRGRPRGRATLGGWLSDQYSWHWCFLINAPVGVIALFLIWWMVQDPKSAVEERKRLRREGVRFDIVGFIWWRPFWARSRSSSTRASARTGSART